MKLDNYKKFEYYTGQDYDDESYYDEDDDSMYGRPYYGKKSKSKEEDEYEQEIKNSSKYSDYDDDEYEEDDDMSHLLYLLRQMFKNSGIDAEVSNTHLDIIIDVYLNKKERLIEIIKVFEVAKKLRKDILLQYDSEFQLFYTKTGQPVLTFTFIYGDGQDDDNAPF